MKKIVFLGLLTIIPAFTQQPKFEIADVHVSTTAKGFAQNFGGVLRAGRYVNRDATMLNLIEAAYSVSEDSISGGPGWVSSDLFDVIAKVPDGEPRHARALGPLHNESPPHTVCATATAKPTAQDRTGSDRQ